jgi:tetratricopeptide (TPR) repeat protein
VSSEVFLEKLQHSETRREVFEYALDAMLAQLTPERALVAFRDRDTEELTAQATHGLDPQTVFLAGEISTELIKTVMRDKQSMLLVDAARDPKMNDRTSVILSGLRSIVCVPILHASGLVLGLVYADNRIRAGAFGQPHEEWCKQLTSLMAQRLSHIERAQAAERANRPQTVALADIDEAAWTAQRQKAFALFREGKHPEAIAELKQVAAQAMAWGPKDPRPGRILGELAEMQRQGQAHADAERNFLQSIDHLEKLGTAYRNELAPVITNLATLYFAQGNSVRSEGLYRRALEIWESQISADDKRLAPLFFNLATLRRSAGAQEEARKLFERALMIAEKNWGCDHANSVRCRTALAEMV